MATPDPLRDPIDSERRGDCKMDAISSEMKVSAMDVVSFPFCKRRFFSRLSLVNLSGVARSRSHNIKYSS